jgi:hypothetical protein
MECNAVSVIAGQEKEEKITVSKSSREEGKQQAVRTISVRLKYPIYVQKKDGGWGGVGEWKVSKCNTLCIFG